MKKKLFRMKLMKSFTAWGRKTWYGWANYEAKCMYIHACIRIYLYTYIHTYVYSYVWEREREIIYTYICIQVDACVLHYVSCSYPQWYAKYRKLGILSIYMYLYMYVCVCVCERERERERDLVFLVYVFVCVCARGREGGREGGEREREREKETWYT